MLAGFGRIRDQLGVPAMFSEEVERAAAPAFNSATRSGRAASCGSTQTKAARTRS